MSKGPRLNNISRNFTTRNSLGIDTVANSISNEVCPIVTTVTPRAFYWAFITWCFYDYYKNCAPEDRKTDNVYAYIKMINFFFALCTDITKTDCANGFTGEESLKYIIDFDQSSFFYDDKYLKNLSNMNYYLSGIDRMGFVISFDPETLEELKYPHLTKDGEKLAIAFDKIFSKTVFYQKYRHSGLNVPKDVILDLRKYININLDGFDEAKEILKDHLFNRKSNYKLIESHNYVKFINKNYSLEGLNNSKCREILFDYFSPYGQYKYNFPDEIKDIINSWEILVGRQYFSAGLGMIWKFMLENLNSPKTYKKWFEDCLNNSRINLNLEDNLDAIINQCDFDFNTREEMIFNARSKSSSHEDNIENGLKIILSIYNRLYNREDFNVENLNYYNYGSDDGSLSLNEFFNEVNNYREKSIKDFLIFIMYRYLLVQHLNTAFEKMLNGRDGYYVEKIEDEYVRKEYFDLDFQNIRMVQLYMVMSDLNLLEAD